MNTEAINGGGLVQLFIFVRVVGLAHDMAADYSVRSSKSIKIVVVFQMLDMVRPEENDKISLRDLKKCRMTPIFFDTFFNLEKYLDHEQRDPFASHRAEDEGPEVSSRTAGLGKQFPISRGF